MQALNVYMFRADRNQSAIQVNSTIHGNDLEEIHILFREFF
jgi:hypothetical protein